jgi:hypothetical protein
MLVWERRSIFLRLRLDLHSRGHHFVPIKNNYNIYKTQFIMSGDSDLYDLEINFDEVMDAVEEEQPGPVAHAAAQPEDGPSDFTMASQPQDDPSGFSMGSLEPFPLNHNEGSFASSVAQEIAAALLRDDEQNNPSPAPPAAPPPSATVASNMVTALPAALILQGGDIPTLMPGLMHFICGCSGLSPLQHAIFLQVVHTYFVERLKDPDFYRLCGTRFPVRGETAAIIEQAKKVPGYQGVRIWTVVGKTRLRESNWMDLEFEDVTNNPVRRRERLEAPLRSILSKLYTNSRSSKTPRYPSATGGQQSVAVADDLPANQLRRSHDEFAGTTNVLGAGMFRQVASTTAGLAPTLKAPLVMPVVLPETDRSWEMKGDWSGSIMYESAMAMELCESINKPHTYVTSLRSIVNEQLPHQANSLLAKKVAKTWLDEQPTSRWVCWIDASDPSTLCESYRQLVRKLHGGNGKNLQPAAANRRRLSTQAAASEFLTEFRAHFSPAHECLIVYENVTHPDIFSEGFLPRLWLQDSHCANTIRGIILSTPHTLYDGDMGAPFGSVVQHSVEWISRFSETEQMNWWERLPQSNLPPLLDDVEEPPEIGPILAFDGRAVALVNPGSESTDHTGDVANQFCRRWQMTDNAVRFSLWLNASSEQNLRDSYRAAIRRVTHSSPQCPLGNPTDLAIRTISNELMATLMKMRELSPSFQWVMVFAGKPPTDLFHENFFSAATNWWNSRGRFIVTSPLSSDPVEVELVVDDEAVRKQLAMVFCR